MKAATGLAEGRAAGRFLLEADETGRLGEAPLCRVSQSYYGPTVTRR
jgi:hypothetical protein